jgi:2-polyprenyl-3-methyl-5-hydroxy-6-metoxy-1,4-benzoquinol methylase
MATSDHWQIPHVVSIFKDLDPDTVLDVGCGWGKYGLLAREYSRASRVDGVDMYAPRYPVYDHAYQGNIREIERVLPPDAPRYDLVILIEVIEHLEKPAAYELLDKLRRIGKRVLVTTPIGFRVQDIPDMPYEKHRSGWMPWEFQKAGKILHFEIYPGHYTRKLHLPSHWQQLHLLAGLPA